MNNDESKYEIEERIAILMEGGMPEGKAVLQAHAELAARKSSEQWKRLAEQGERT